MVADQKHTTQHIKLPKLDLATHRRLLNYFNGAAYADDLVFEKIPPAHEGHDGGAHEDNPSEHKIERHQLLDRDVARKLVEWRDAEFPLGFRHVREILDLAIIDRGIFDHLFHHFGSAVYGRWSVFPQLIPRRGPGSYDGIVHAAMLHTGKVLFITADETTLLWDPANTTAATFENPLNQPHQIPDAASGYSVLCGGHSFLSDGKLLVAGGGGYGPNSRAVWGYKFDADATSWSRTTGQMVHNRWYPTVLTLGDQRMGNSHELLVVCGHGGGDMEIYDEASDRFIEVTMGDDKGFPNLYPGLHLLPNHSIFYTRTGWGSATAGPGQRSSPFSNDDQSSYFVFSGHDTGLWNNIAPVTPSMPDRTKGMSVMLLSTTPPYVRVLVAGGLDPATNNTYEIMDVSTLSPATNWAPAQPFPDGEHRSLCSAVLLPDGTVFVCGGIQRSNSPCTLFNPQTNTWSAMADLPSVRDYHSAALLLPSGQVMMAGWNNTAIEIFDPPYLFQGARPVIANAPALVHHGQSFVIESPDAAAIVKVVLVRPMAVTHQTDTQQKVIEMPYVHNHANPVQLTLTAPHGGHPHSYAQQGFYMMFALNNAGVPSVARWIYLH